MKENGDGGERRGSNNIGEKIMYEKKQGRDMQKRQRNEMKRYKNKRKEKRREEEAHEIKECVDKKIKVFKEKKGEK